MKLDLKALTVAFAILWAGVVLLVGMANLMWPGYGKSFLLILASIYPGYAASGSFGDVIVWSVNRLSQLSSKNLIVHQDMHRILRLGHRMVSMRSPPLALAR
jgi:hypothetical protein